VRTILDVAEAKAFLGFPSPFITDLTHYTKDPQVLYAARAGIADCIERLARTK
jgi:hypothetical protein